MVEETSLSGPRGLVLDSARRTVAIDDDHVDLSRREFDFLHLLLEERGRVVPFDELARRVWHHEVATSDQRFIYTTAWRLRRALEAADAGGVIEGVRGVGYVVHDTDRPFVDDAPSSVRIGAQPDGSFQAPAMAVVDPWDPDLRLTMVNDAAVELTGYSTDELGHLPEIERRLWGSPDRGIVFEAADRAITNGEAITTGRRLTRADGSHLLVDLKFSRMAGPGKEPLLVSETVRSRAGRPEIGGQRAAR
jgi:PAS domain S-box-containing protein